MFGLSRFQFGVSDADMIKSQSQTPLLDIKAQLTKVIASFRCAICIRVGHD